MVKYLWSRFASTELTKFDSYLGLRLSFPRRLLIEDTEPVFISSMATNSSGCSYIIIIITGQTVITDI